jgi:hypothetical protein
LRSGYRISSGLTAGKCSTGRAAGCTGYIRRAAGRRHLGARPSWLSAARPTRMAPGNQQETGKDSSAPAEPDRRAMIAPGDGRLPRYGICGTGTVAAVGAVVYALSNMVCWAERWRSVKPSAQPTLVRTQYLPQHLPPPAKMARSLGILGYAGRSVLAGAQRVDFALAGVPAPAEPGTIRAPGLRTSGFSTDDEASRPLSTDVLAVMPSGPSRYGTQSPDPARCKPHRKADRAATAACSPSIATTGPARDAGHSGHARRGGSVPSRDQSG